MIDRVKKQITHRLNNLTKVDLEKAFKVKVDCPCETLPEKIKQPKIEALVMKINVMDEPVSQKQINTAILFGVKEQLYKQGLCLNIIRSNIVEVEPDLDRITLRCPKIPMNTDARIGVRNDCYAMTDLSYKVSGAISIFPGHTTVPCSTRAAIKRAPFRRLNGRL